MASFEGYVDPLAFLDTMDQISLNKFADTAQSTSSVSKFEYTLRVDSNCCSRNPQTLHKPTTGYGQEMQLRMVRT